MPQDICGKQFLEVSQPVHRLVPRNYGMLTMTERQHFPTLCPLEDGQSQTLSNTKEIPLCVEQEWIKIIIPDQIRN